MIGGFIQKQQVRLLIEEGGQGGTGLPSPAQGLDGPGKIGFLEAKAFKDLFRLVSGIGEFQGGQPLVDFSKGLRQFFLVCLVMDPLQ